MAETPRLAHLTILLLMGTELCVVLSLLTALGAAAARRKFAALAAGGLAAGIAAGYACVLLGVGWMSGERILAPGQWKYFCEADCHIAYTVDGVSAEPAGGAAEGSTAASRSRVLVRLKTWFDENSIAKFRGNGPLRPEARSVVLVDANGQRYAAEAGAEAGGGSESTSMSTPLRPGESYITLLTFDVPGGARDLRLLVTDVDPASRFIIDHENSPLHGKILLRLPEAGGALHSALR